MTVQAARVRMRTKKFMSMTDGVAANIEVNEELTLATAEARRIMRDRRHLQEATQEREGEAVKMQHARFQGVVATNRLRDIATSQMQEILFLTREMDRWRRKSFPAFVGTSRSLPTSPGTAISKVRR